MTRFAFETLHHEAKKAIEAEGLRPFTRRTGLPMGVVRSITDDRDMSISSTLAVAEALGFDVFVQPKRLGSGFSEDPEPSSLVSKNALRSGFLPIPWHKELGFKGSAPVAFSADWLAAQGLTPDNLAAVAPSSDSFLFADRKNYVAIIDTHAPEAGASDYWCYREGAQLGIYRTAFHKDVVVLLTSADAGDIRVISRPLPSDLKILGRVVWSGHAW